jgi:CBS domain-containing protein
VLRPDDDVQHAARLVRERAVRRLPVIADGVPVGMVSIGDLALDRDARAALSANGPDR